MVQAMVRQTPMARFGGLLVLILLVATGCASVSYASDVSRSLESIDVIAGVKWTAAGHTTSDVVIPVVAVNLVF